MKLLSYIAQRPCSKDIENTVRHCRQKHYNASGVKTLPLHFKLTPVLQITRQTFLSMAIDVIEATDLILQLENFCEKLRPKDEGIRKKLDYGYTIENQSVFLVEIRPDWLNPTNIRHSAFAKTTFIKARNIWKVYWMRGNLTWCLYEPNPTVRELKAFLDLVVADEYHCFFG